MKVIALSIMTSLPPNCMECPFQSCNLPMRADGIHLMTSCLKKRHPRCPLYEVEVQDG